MSTQTVLICTVGGSHQPILTAIRELQPNFVHFACSGKDPTTGRDGSEKQIVGKGSVIKKNFNDEKPTLPNIPTQAKLSEEQFELGLIPTDDLEEGYTRLLEAIKSLQKRFPESHLIADYTGGTKTMTAALVMAALQTEGVELNLVTGMRGNLIKVNDGCQASYPVTVERLHLQRHIDNALENWSSYGYSQAWLRLKPIKASPALRSQLLQARDLSRAFDAWDRFDHLLAKALLEQYRPKVGRVLCSHYTHLEFLTCGADDRRAEPAKLWDLYFNAQRRASQGRYDDAVARVYRLLEWTAQWLLRDRCDLDTSNLPADAIPDHVKVMTNAKGQKQAGLFAAWDLVAHHLQAEAKAFAEIERNRLQNQIKIRNQSIFAHGFSPIVKEEWDSFHAWLNEKYIPLLSAEAKKSGLKLQPQQLPSSWIGDEALV